MLMMIFEVFDNTNRKENFQNINEDTDATVEFVAELFSFLDLTKSKIEDIKRLTSKLLGKSLSNFYKDISNHVIYLGVNRNNLNKMQNLVDAKIKDYSIFKSEYDYLKTFEHNGTLIMPESTKIGEKTDYVIQEGKSVPKTTSIDVQFIPIYKVFKNYLEMSGVFEGLTNYLKELKETKDGDAIFNIIQSPAWQKNTQICRNGKFFSLADYFVFR